MADRAMAKRKPTNPLLSHAHLRLSRRTLGNTLFYLALGAGALVMVLPLVWMVSASLKEPNQIFTVPIQWWPNPFRWQNYSESLSSAPFGRYFFNSLVVGGITTLSVLFFSSLSGFGFAKYSFFGRNILFLLILSTLMVPFQVIMVPLYLLMRDFHWINSYRGLIVPGAMSAFGVFLMRQFILTLPDELFDAARIDGSGEFGTYLRLVLPLSKGPLAALAVFTFLDSWNNLLWPLIIVDDDSLRTLPLGLTEFQSRYNTSYHYLMAASTAAAIPVVLLFVLLQKQFIQGIALTGLKS